MPRATRSLGAFGGPWSAARPGRVMDPVVRSGTIRDTTGIGIDTNIDVDTVKKTDHSKRDDHYIE